MKVYFSTQNDDKSFTANTETILWTLYLCDDFIINYISGEHLLRFKSFSVLKL